MYNCHTLDKTVVHLYLPYSMQPFEGHESEKIGSIVSGAVITSNGKLTPSFEYIAGLREAQSRVNVPGDFSSEKKVSSHMFPAVESKCHITYNFEKHTSCVIIFQALVLGAGFVSAPVIDYLTRDSSLGVTVAAAIKEEANKLATRYHTFFSL